MSCLPSVIKCSICKQTRNFGTCLGVKMSICEYVVFTSQVWRVGGCMCYGSTGLFCFTHPPSSETKQDNGQVKADHMDMHPKTWVKQPHLTKWESLIHWFPRCLRAKKTGCIRSFIRAQMSVLNLRCRHVCVLVFGVSRFSCFHGERRMRCMYE